MPEISIIIPTFNKDFYLDLTLAGFCTQLNKDFEIVIINDGGALSVANLVDKYERLLNIKYHYHTTNGGRASARNHGLNIAEGQVVIFNDDDRIPCPAFVQAHLDTIKADNSRVSIGSKHVIFSYYKKQLNVKFYRFHEMLKKNPQLINLITKEDEGPLFGADEVIDNFEEIIHKWHFWNPIDNHDNVTSHYGDQLTGFHLSWMLSTTGNMAYNRNDCSNVNFDEGFSGWGVEDTEFAYRLKLLGKHFVFNRESTNYHQIHERNHMEDEELKKNIQYFMRKYNNPEIALFTRYFRQEIDLILANQIIDLLDRMALDTCAQDYKKLLIERTRFFA